MDLGLSWVELDHLLKSQQLHPELGPTVEEWDPVWSHPAYPASVLLEGGVPPGLRAVGKQPGEASQCSPVGDRAGETGQRVPSRADGRLPRGPLLSM